MELNFHFLKCFYSVHEEAFALTENQDRFPSAHTPFILKFSESLLLVFDVNIGWGSKLTETLG